VHKVDKLNENHGALIIAGIAVLLVCLLAVFLPPTLDGMSYGAAVGDSFGLRIAKLAVFDLHAVGVLYFYGGRSWKVTQLFKTKPISTALLLAAIFIGSAMMLM
jgi:hypothetical protein